MTTICKAGQVRKNSAASLIKKQTTSKIIFVYSKRSWLCAWLNETNVTTTTTTPMKKKNECEEKHKHDALESLSSEWLAIGATKRSTHKNIRTMK